VIGLLLSALFSFSAGICELKPYDPGPKPAFYQICRAKDKRGPASIKNNLALKPKRSLDRLAKYSLSERRMYIALKRGSFHNADFNNDGKADVKVRRLGKGYKEIKHSYKGNGQFNQISVYNAQGKLVKERVDYDMDGNVDYLYECKDQVCETRSDFVSGEANKLIKQTLNGDQQTFEVFQRKSNGNFVLKSTTTKKVKTIEMASSENIVDHTEGQAMCENCDEELTAFSRLLEDMQNIQKQSAKKDEMGDFVISRLGIMIHKNCLAPGRFKFDVEEAITNSLVKGMSCLAEGEDYYSDRTNPGAVIKKTSTKYSIFPQFLNYMDKSKWDQSAVPYSTHANGDKYLFDSCDKIKETKFFGKTMLPDCEVVSDFANRPKVFCEEDLTYAYQIESTDNTWLSNSLLNNTAYASVGSNSPVIINHQNKTKVYNGPSLVFRSSTTKDIAKGKFEAMVFHEMIHNLGYVHEESMPSGEHLHNDFASLCEAACFMDEYSAVLSEAEIGDADMYCFDHKPTKKSEELAGTIRYKMGNAR